MPDVKHTKNKSAAKSQKDAAARGKESAAKAATKKYIVVASAILLLIILFSAFYFGYRGAGAKSKYGFSTFQSNFDASSNVSIVVDYNSSAFQYEIGCATNIIYNLVSSRIKNSASITFFVINSTNCTYLQNGLGKIAKNYSYASPAACIDIAQKHPAIFINSSAVNNTVIKPNALYISGNDDFLKQCGIASIIK
ncbi:MAG: hypothetical protein M1331_00960 [Candidatus Marsarchaeota archaeon]|nr:hypothetical protein [Candidatus Marsarchaeota archaeon]